MARRVEFLEEAVAELADVRRTPWRVVRGRAEERSVAGAVGPVDVVTARAVAPLPRLVGWCRGLLRPGTQLVALVGRARAGGAARPGARTRGGGDARHPSAGSRCGPGVGCHYRGGHDARDCTVTAPRAERSSLFHVEQVQRPDPFHVKRHGRKDCDDRPGRAAAEQPRRGPVASSRGMADFDSPIAMEALRATRVLHAADQDPFPAPARIRIITIANQKGGVGKTTSTVNLGVALALYGLRTLVIDLDPQGNASTALGVDHTVGTPSVYDALVGDSTLAEVVHPTTASPKLLCVPATIDLAGAEIELVSVVAREHRLRRAIEALHRTRSPPEQRPHYVLIDCPPSLGLLTLNALVAGDEVLIPIQCEYYALEGLGQLLNNIDLVRAAPQPGHRRPHDPADDVRRPDEARRPGRRRGAQPLRRRRAARRSSPATSGCPRRRATASRC